MKESKKKVESVENSNMKVKIKKLHENAVIPKYAKPGDAGMDLVAVTQSILPDGIVYGTGLAMEIPEGYVGLLFPRSSNCKKTLLLTNSVGVIDSGYRGEIKMVFDTYRIPGKKYEVGDRVGQLIIIPYPQVEFEEVQELNSSERGEGSYGSTGK